MLSVRPEQLPHLLQSAQFPTQQPSPGLIVGNRGCHTRDVGTRERHARGMMQTRRRNCRNLWLCLRCNGDMRKPGMQARRPDRELPRGRGQSMSRLRESRRGEP